MYILHGWTYSAHDTWNPLLDILRARGVELEFLSIPGLTDGTDPVWDLDDYVEWLNAKVGNEKAILYGHSNGGRISIAFAAKYPEKVGKLVIEDSSGIPPSGLRRLKRDVFRSVTKLFGGMARSERLRKFVYKVIRESDYQRASPNMRRTMSNLVSADLRKVLHRITAPTLVVWGAGDKVTTLKDGEAIHRGIRGSKMLVIPDARHSPHITHPQHVADALLTFIAS